MPHTIAYIIESDDDLRLEYLELPSAPYFQPEWIYGLNSFNNIEDADADEVGSPDIVRVETDGGYLYYQKVLRVPCSSVNFRISVLIDGIEGNTSFVCSGFNTFINTRRLGSEVYTSVSMNRRPEERQGRLTISYTSDDSISTSLAIIQEQCEISLSLISCAANDGVSETEYNISSDFFDYTFDTLTEASDASFQKLLFRVSAVGPSSKFYLKAIKKYAEVGEIDDTYKYIDGKFYKRRQKVVDGEFVTYYDEALVIDNIGYELKVYDGAFATSIGPDDTFEIRNYGRVYMESKAFYEVLLANYDDINKTCRIRLYFS